MGEPGQRPGGEGGWRGLEGGRLRLEAARWDLDLARECLDVARDYLDMVRLDLSAVRLGLDWLRREWDGGRGCGGRLSRYFEGLRQGLERLWGGGGGGAKVGWRGQSGSGGGARRPSMVRVRIARAFGGVCGEGRGISGGAGLDEGCGPVLGECQG